MSNWEILGSLLGLIGVALMIRQHIWAWPVGLVQVSVYAWVFYDAKLYSDAILQVFFFVLQAYGWWHWRDAAVRSRTELPVSRLGRRAVLAYIVVGAIATAGWGEMMRRTTDAALPRWDAFILVFSLIAQWLQARKRLENWIGWMIVNGVVVGVCWQKGLRLTAGLYVVFFLMAVVGHRTWQRTFRESSAR